MPDQEQIWDKTLQIQTIGRDDTHADAYRYPYEPTPYCVLQRLADCGLIGEENVVLDYGCGRGRVDFFLSYRTKAKTIGIEYDESIFAGAVDNQRTALSKAQAEFVLVRAEAFALPETVDRCYFFNPFSVEILRKVMARIVASYYENPRQMYLFFYYPSEEYVSYLMTVDELDFYDEIPCGDLFPGKDQRETILIFQLP